MVTDPLELLLEVIRGQPAPPGEPAERLELRQRLEREVAEIRARGRIVWIPAETA